MSKTIKPLYDRLLVKRLDSEEKTASGIIIPDTAKEKAQYGEVIEVGAGKISKDGCATPLTVKKGDKVLFGKYSGTEIKLESQEYLIIREDEVLGILR